MFILFTFESVLVKIFEAVLVKAMIFAYAHMIFN